MKGQAGEKTGKQDSERTSIGQTSAPARTKNGLNGSSIHAHFRKKGFCSAYTHSVRAQDPLFLIQGHVVYTFKRGLWASVSAGYGFGGESSINGVSRDDKNDNYFWALTVSAPVARYQNIKLTYAGVQTNNLVGIDSDNLLLAWSLLF